MRSMLAALPLPLLLAAGLLAPAAEAAPPVSSPPSSSVSPQLSPAPGDAGYAIKPFRLRDDDSPRLVKAWRTWRAQDHRSYTTVVRRSCFCLDEPPLRTDVRRKRVTSVTFAGRSRELRRDGYEVDALYRILRKAYNQADELVVRYRRGVPVSVYVDSDRHIADEEFGLRVRVSDVGGH